MIMIMIMIIVITTIFFISSIIHRRFLLSRNLDEYAVIQIREIYTQSDIH